MNRTLIAGGVALGVLLIIVSVRQLLVAYRSAFVGDLGAQLKKNFILTNPQVLFISSLVGALVLGVIGYRAGGPVVAAGGCILAVAAPKLWASVLLGRRRKQFIYQLPDALLSLASALRAGSNLSKGLEQLAVRQPAPLSQEFSIVLAEYNVGRALDQSLAEMRERIGATELDLMNAAINASRNVGGNLADTLDSLARTLQEKAAMEGKIEALTAMGRAQMWVVCALPFVVSLALFKLQPERMGPLLSEPVGWAVLGVAGVMMAGAVTWIRKIVSIDI
jgi:tight adherence protein B